MLATGRDIRCSIATIGSAAGLAPAALTGRLWSANALGSGPAGTRHAYTSGTLAWLTELKGRYADAEQQYRDILADRRRLLGDDHPDTLTSRATLAGLASRQGRRAEAEDLYRRVIADRTRVLGASHPDTAAVRNELAQAVAL